MTWILVNKKDWPEGLEEVNSKSDGTWKFIYGKISRDTFEV